MENAIKKSIEGGWNCFGQATNALFSWSIDKLAYGDIKRGLFTWSWAERNNGRIEQRSRDIDVSAIFSEPLFWSSLGKAMGWKNSCPSTYGCDGEMVKATGTGAVMFPLQCNKCGGYGYEGDYITWIKNWHSFIDHLAEGKDVDSFFNNLIK